MRPPWVRPAPGGVEVVFHQAALRSVPRSMAHPLETNGVNRTGTLRVLQQARAAGVRRVVSASSSAVYGDTELPKHEGQVPQPKSPYAASKLAGEAYCAVYSRGFDLPTVALRPPPGPRRRDASPRLHLRGQRSGGQPPGGGV